MTLVLSGLLIEAAIFVAIILFSRSVFTNLFLHRMILTDHELIDRFRLPWLTRRIPLTNVVTFRVIEHEHFDGEYAVRDTPHTSRTLVLLGSDGETIAEVDLSAFADAEIRRLVSVLNQVVRAH